MKVRPITIGMVLLFLSSSTFALIGPPTAGLTQGQWSFGGDYQYSSQDLETTKVDYTCIDYDSAGDVTGIDEDSYKLEIRDFNINRCLGRLSYGLFDSWEVYGQLGIANVKAKARDEDDSWYSDNFDNSFAWGVGTRYTFFRQSNIDWGVGAQVNGLNLHWDGCFNYDDGEGYTEDWEENVDICAIDLFVVAGPTINMGGWKLYGGPFYRYICGNYNYKENGTWDDGEDTGSWICKDNGDAETNSFGGYIGANMDVYKNYNLAIEFFGTDNGWGTGAGITIPF